MTSPTPRSPTSHRIPGFRAVPFTGVIYVMAEAARHGYRYGHPDWCNLGQGQPETGPLPGAPPRVEQVAIAPDDQEYAPVAGIPELRRAVADLYNRLYRQGRASLYTERNVCISGGGRASLTRAVAALGHINLGHFLPDYTAYEELLDIFKLFTAIPILLDGATGYRFGVDELRREITGRGLSAVLLSNPCNPTGKVIQGPELEAWVAASRELQCSLLIDEFYSHYIWSSEDGAEMVSAARYVEDVDADPVVLFDGFTKNWRYPGWRCTWIVGPEAVIDAVSSSGSFLDGGGSKPLQRSAVPLLSPDIACAETGAIRRAFSRKRQLLLDGLRDAGMRFDLEPEGTFYCWADVSGLPAGLDDGMSLFRALLERGVICVPGEFFDVNPGKRRSGRPSRFKRYVRFSFGAEEAQVVEGVRRVREVVRRG
ncbi:MAG TPA: pyridoxal phosphate-dependent aminotransferase [Gemmatimonadales bacterium]|nr:pyridoxal phosphate-dependent aminotransferase [Gemmatimonadales bacterium]